MSYDRTKLEAELTRDEGERLVVYRCTAGKATIGVGRNLDDVGISAAEAQALHITTGVCKLGVPITRVQSRALLANDIDRCEADLDRRIAWWRTLDDVRQRVLLNMCFNMGIGTLATFRNTLAKMRAGDFDAAADGMRASRWHRQVGARALRLEAMMETGKDAA